MKLNTTKDGYKNKVDWIMELSENEVKAIKTEKELAKFFWIEENEITSLLEKDYPKTSSTLRTS
jgi:hypothetical protein